MAVRGAGQTWGGLSGPPRLWTPGGGLSGCPHTAAACACARHQVRACFWRDHGQIHPSLQGLGFRV